MTQMPGGPTGPSTPPPAPTGSGQSGAPAGQELQPTTAPQSPDLPQPNADVQGGEPDARTAEEQARQAQEKIARAEAAKAAAGSRVPPGNVGEEGLQALVPQSETTPLSPEALGEQLAQRLENAAQTFLDDHPQIDSNPQYAAHLTQVKQSADYINERGRIMQSTPPENQQEQLAALDNVARKEAAIALGHDMVNKPDLRTALGVDEANPLVVAMREATAQMQQPEAQQQVLDQAEQHAPGITAAIADIQNDARNGLDISGKLLGLKQWFDKQPRGLKILLLLILISNLSSIFGPALGGVAVIGGVLQLVPIMGSPAGIAVTGRMAGAGGKKVWQQTPWGKQGHGSVSAEHAAPAADAESPAQVEHVVPAAAAQDASSAAVGQQPPAAPESTATPDQEQAEVEEASTESAAPTSTTQASGDAGSTGAPLPEQTAPAPQSQSNPPVGPTVPPAPDSGVQQSVLEPHQPQPTLPPPGGTAGGTGGAVS